MDEVCSFFKDPQNEWIWHPVQAGLVVFGFLLVLRQMRLARDQNSISHLNYFREVWNSDTLLRARLATVKSETNSALEFEGYEDVVATFMEDLGAAVHAGQANAEHVWNYYSYYVDGYWQLLQSKVAHYRERSGDRTYFERFESLYRICLKTNEKHSTFSMPNSYIYLFRKEEERAVQFMLGE